MGWLLLGWLLLGWLLLIFSLNKTPLGETGCPSEKLDTPHCAALV